jgi:spermidine synthase
VRHNGRVSQAQPVSDPRATVFLVGFATVGAQALLVREAMAAMGGSELAWGVVMFLWLFGMAGGARLGVRLGSARLAAWLPTLVLILAGLGVVALRAAPAVIGAAPGETVTTASAIWLWIVAIVPAAGAGGLAFPALAQAIGADGGGRAYAFEASGALVGGTLLTIGLVYVGAATALLVGLGIVAAAAAWQQRALTPAAVAIAAFAVSIPAGGALARAGWVWSGHPGTLRAAIETRFQQVVISDGPPTSIYGDGRLMATYPDPYRVEPRAHLLMILHPRPRDVLAVGCVVDGSIEAMARHRVARLRAVEEDPDLLRALPVVYGVGMESALQRPAVQAAATDPLAALEEGGPWDLVILLDPDPTTLRHNRTRTLEFLQRCRERMHPDGVLVMKVGVSGTYLGGVGGRLLSVLASTVHQVFEQLFVIAGEDTLLVAGGPLAEITLDNETLVRRQAASASDPADLPPEMVSLLVDRDRSSDLQSQVRLDSARNTIRRPRAVLLAGGLHEARALPGLLPAAAELEETDAWPLAAGLGIIVAMLAAAAVLGRRATGATAAIVGFCSMGWWLLMIAAWQSTRGSVYSEIGALTAVFMAGLAAGSLAATRISNPDRWVPPVLVAGSALSGAIAAGCALSSPLVAIPSLLAVGGLLTGAAFPGLTRLGSPDPRRAAGVAFSADQVGAAAAALAVGILMIPWVGTTVTALGLAALQLAAVPLVIANLRRS